MAGCKKADRNRKKSPAMQRYKGSGRMQINKLKKQAREERMQRQKTARKAAGKVKERGLTRKIRRSHGKTQRGQKNHSTMQQKQLAEALQRTLQP